MQDPFPYHLHRHVRDARKKRRPTTKSVRSPDVKEYPRMMRVTLPCPDLTMPLGQALSKRASLRSFSRGHTMDTEDLGALLGHSLRARPAGTRPYPSGGGLYPIETYVIVRKIKGIDAGRYHYHHGAHALEKIPSEGSEERLFDGMESMWTRGAEAIIIFTAVWKRTSPQYGDFSYLLGLLEAGHIAQNILLSAAALSISACPLAGFDDQTAIDMLELDGEEQPVYAITLGK